MNYSPLIYIDIYQDKICLAIYLHHYPNNSLLCHKDLVVVLHQLLIIQCKMKHPHDLMI
jgi:hypothetical protein